jgi:tetratricopeptide (TPR) repeat protein
MSDPTRSDALKEAESLENRGAFAWNQANYTDAQRVYEQALVIRERLQGTHPAVARTLNHLGQIAQARGEYAQASARYQRAFEIYEQAYGLASLKSIQVQGNRAVTLDELGLSQQARVLLEEALALAERVLGVQHAETVRAACNLARHWRIQRDYDRAEPLFQRAVQLAEQLPAADPADLAPILNEFGVLSLDQNRPNDADLLLVRTMMLWRRSTVPDDHPVIGFVLRDLGRMALQRGNEEEAVDFTERAVSILQAKLPPTHPERIAAEQTFQSLLARARQQRWLKEQGERDGEPENGST